MGFVHLLKTSAMISTMIKYRNSLVFVLSDTQKLCFPPDGYSNEIKNFKSRCLRQIREREKQIPADRLVKRLFEKYLTSSPPAR